MTLRLGTWTELGRLEELGRLDTPVHRIDARAKALTTMAFIVSVVSFSRYEVSALTPFFVYPLALMSLGRIPPGAILRKILIAAPFALAIGIFNPFFDRHPVAVIGSVPISGGWLSFLSILLRFLLTVGAALALVACTGMHRLCAGLGRLGLPRVFVVQLLFLHRYLFVIAEEGSRMLRSVELRSTGPRPLRWRVFGPLVGHLLLRSMSRADRVYRGMVARGFDGEIRILRPAPFRWADLVFVGGWTAFFAAARVWNLAAGLGALLTGGAR